MQEFRGEELVKTMSPDELKEIQKTLSDELEEIPKMREDSTHQVIGKIPKKGTTIKVNGLIYDVIFSDSIRGIFHAKIKRP